MKHGIFTLKEECRLSLFDNRILRQIIGHKKDENNEWRRLNNGETSKFVLFPNIIKVIKSIRLRWADRVARMEEGRSAFQMLTGKTYRKEAFRNTWA